MPGYFLRPPKQEIDVWQLALEPFDLRLVTQAELMSDLGSPLLVSKQNHLDVWMQKRPAFQRIALDDRAVPLKGLCCGE
jgi:hypothetical protein